MRSYHIGAAEELLATGDSRSACNRNTESTFCKVVQSGYPDAVRLIIRHVVDPSSCADPDNPSIGWAVH